MLQLTNAKTTICSKRAMGKICGLSPKQIIWIYKIIIIKILSYRSVVWAMNLTKSQIVEITTRRKTSTPKSLLDVVVNTLMCSLY